MQPVAGTNNESERTLRNPAEARDTRRTTKTPLGAPSNDQCQRVGIVASILAVADVDEGHRGNPALGPDGPQLLRGTDRQTRPDGLHFINPRSYRAASQRIIGTRSGRVGRWRFRPTEHPPRHHQPPHTRRGRLCHSTSIPGRMRFAAQLTAHRMDSYDSAARGGRLDRSCETTPVGRTAALRTEFHTCSTTRTAIQQALSDTLWAAWSARNTARNRRWESPTHRWQQIVE